MTSTLRRRYGRSRFGVPGTLTEEQASAIAKEMFGPRGFAITQRKYRVEEQDFMGEVYGYLVGYGRTGKKGSHVSSWKGESDTSFEDALEKAEASMTPKQRAAYEKRRAR